jgi:trans-2-enoyl-CoA reductase
LSVITYPSLPPPTPGTVNIRFLLSPVNPADINVIEGVYPARPTLTSSLAESGKGSKESPVFIGGNEGLAMVTAVGGNSVGLQVGDWVVMVKQQAGTWTTSQNVKAHDVVKIPDRQGLSEVHAATITVNYLPSPFLV